MNETSENVKKKNLDQICPSPQIWAQKLFFRGFYLYYMLDIVASYHCIQFQGKLTIQTQENVQKPHFGPDLGLLAEIRAAKLFFQKSGFVSH